MKTTAAYAASKRAIAQLTKVIALEYGEQGIRANAIGAGVIETDILSGIVEDSRATLAGYGHMHALGRSASRRRLRKPWPGSLHRVPASLQARWSWRMRVHSHVGPLRLAPAGITLTAQKRNGSTIYPVHQLTMDGHCANEGFW